MAGAALQHEPLFSRLGNDPDLREIINLFVQEMPDRMEKLRRQSSNGNWEELRRTAHQLKGAAGSYGFPLISPSAGQLEHAIRNAEPEHRIRELVHELIELCSLVQCS